ncbi:hypothetical protein GALMADRAFT_214569 [Galerina marginata CBS 339.88]|uniref:F-box domain-containing protein n=1 Tax=Galerina marginata (strain CBS 339.88) TaxID=685588 RepID=A0A067SUT0_GALM3|nr:hypothetical protein GALMADRAFT_214569 [Galerina marginata CBS 339.88]
MTQGVHPMSEAKEEAKIVLQSTGSDAGTGPIAPIHPSSRSNWLFHCQHLLLTFKPLKHLFLARGWLPLREYRKWPPKISIAFLNDDLLLRIFSLNTLTDADIVQKIFSTNEYSLITARHTSQVCAGWRFLMLGSSVFWANSINLKHLDQKNDNWRREILNRTGTSLLSVMGHLPEGRHAAQFFLSLLGNHWMRLQRISVYISDPSVIQDERWLSIQSPAPNLEVFCIEFSSPPTFSTADDVLFSNDAPSINTFITNNINFNFSGRWLSHLRCLDLTSFSISQTFLCSLAEMFALESLGIADVDIHAEDCEWPMIILPKLKRLSLCVNLRTLILLMGCITPTSGCISQYVIWGNPISLPSKEDLILLRRGFSTHFQYFSNLYPTDTISWSMTENIITLNTTLELGGANSAFCFGLEIDGGSPWHGIPDIILHSLCSCGLNSITKLELEMSPDALNICASPFAKLCRSLSSVETMHTDSQTMEVLMQLREDLDGVILFPSLKTIVFDTCADLKCDLIVRFLLQRRDAGVPITEFDLSDCNSSHLDRLLFLGGINGLNVKWKEEIQYGI